jgi:hypothetical protein
MGSLNYHHISTLPRLHYIVWCRLPDAEGNPGDTVRPALVRATKRDNKSGRAAVQVSYGTTHLDTNRCRGIDLILMNAARLAQLDLPQAVRFDLGLSNWLPWAVEFFEAPSHSLFMVAGPLSTGEIERVRSCLKQRGVIQAL